MIIKQINSMKSIKGKVAIVYDKTAASVSCKKLNLIL
jgi:hypothetical protein